MTATRHISSSNSRLTMAAGTIALMVLAISIWLTIEFRSQPLLGLHAFRQTQTALTSYWACKQGVQLSYWTPVAGFPWAIPF
ncbi:hypothetical protein, partial [Caballeronia sp. BR00000012568055]|uniref:hypothetical protein n=1 Tax=Caballeronia sp. BR00000012568055 TaxID=2918761 RepID=UPI0023F84F5D